jgi:hypothetical protein
MVVTKSMVQMAKGEAIRMNGPEARELLSLYYQVKGLPEDDALHLVNHIASDPKQFLCALARERLGSSEDALSSPLAAHFAVGAAQSLITVRSWWSSGLEITLVGCN